MVVGIWTAIATTKSKEKEPRKQIQADKIILSVSELSKLVSKINNPHLGLCLDTGHAFVRGESVDLSKDVFECGKNLIALHIQDTDGKKDRHWLPGQGLINWAEFMKDLISIDYQGVLTLEISGCPEFTERNIDNILSKGRESIKNVLKSNYP